MTPISFQSATAYLIDAEPNWQSPVTLEAEIPTYNESGLTAREARRPLGNTLRLGLRYTTVIRGPALPAFRNALQELNTHRVLCPLWLHRLEAGQTETAWSSWYVLAGDGQAPEIKASNQMPFARQAYPLLVGRLASISDPALINDEVAIAEIDFVENDALSLTPPAYIPPNAFDGVLFPWRPNWRTQPKSGAAEVEIERKSIGKSRSTSDAFYTQPSRRRAEQYFTLQGSEPWQLLRLFQDWRATNKSFWLPVGISDAQLTANVAPTDAVLNVNNPAGRGNNTTFLLDDLTTRTPVRVTGTAGNTWPLSAQVGQAYTASQTRIESLVLARFAYNRLTLSFEAPDLASARCTFVEVPWETAAVAGETIGTTMGGLPTTAYLYVFTVAYPGLTQTWRFTDFEIDLLDGTNVYAAKHFEHDEIRETAMLERQETGLRSRTFSGNPLSLLIPFALEWPLMVEIFECDVAGALASNLRCVFYGEVTEGDFDGPYIRASARSLSALFDRKLPRILIQPTCNWSLFEAGCGLLADDWKWQGTVASYNVTTRALVLNNVARVTGPAVTLTAKFFALGYLYTGIGNSAQYRMIADNIASAGSSITLFVSSPFTTPPAVGATVSFHPGCDGRYKETCIARFNNGARFGGFAWMPVGNPSMLKIGKSFTAGGKK